MNQPDEHDYIRQLITDRYWGQVEEQINLLQSQQKELLNRCRYLELDALGEEVENLVQQLRNKRASTEAKLHWLELDSLLRLDGKNYPDFVEETCNENQNKS